MNSEFLQHLVDIKKVPLDFAEWADQYPTPELQSEAIHVLRDETDFDGAFSKQDLAPVMIHELLLSVTKTAFGSHPCRVVSVTYSKLRPFHGGNTG